MQLLTFTFGNKFRAHKLRGRRDTRAGFEITSSTGSNDRRKQAKGAICEAVSVSGEGIPNVKECLDWGGAGNT